MTVADVRRLALAALRPPQRTGVHVLLEAAELRALHARAERDGVSVSAFVRRLIQQALATKGGPRR